MEIEQINCKKNQMHKVECGSICFVDCLGLNQRGGQRYRRDASGGLAEPPSK